MCGSKRHTPETSTSMPKGSSLLESVAHQTQELSKKPLSLDASGNSPSNNSLVSLPPLSPSKVDSIHQTTFQASDEKDYIMSVILQPDKVQPGAALYPPLVVEIRRSNPYKKPTSDLLSVLSLLEEDGQTPLPQNIIDGNKSGSFQILNQNGHEQAIYLFPDIRFKASGKYRLKITLLVPDSGAYKVVQTCVSNIVVVEEDARYYANPRDKELLRMLKDQRLS